MVRPASQKSGQTAFGESKNAGENLTGGVGPGGLIALTVASGIALTVAMIAINTTRAIQAAPQIARGEVAKLNRLHEDSSKYEPIIFDKAGIAYKNFLASTKASLASSKQNNENRIILAQTRDNNLLLAAQN
jgi:hypothetical protein